ncbi:MAG TPA: hypothetical protein PLW65_10775, partial [Pseudomonadota bacterium]|nr:hypothetical protein [Pseudomonadota bacterium]
MLEPTGNAPHQDPSSSSSSISAVMTGLEAAAPAAEFDALWGRERAEADAAPRPLAGRESAALVGFWGGRGPPPAYLAAPALLTGGPAGDSEEAAAPVSKPEALVPAGTEPEAPIPPELRVD